MTVLLVHLSDVHIRESTDEILGQAPAIATCTYKYLPQATRVIILVSGDIAYAGRPSEYQLAQEFLGRLQTEILREAGRPISVVACPGNHDCDFTLDTANRRQLIRQLSDSDAPEVDRSVIDACLVVQQPYLEFQKTINPDALADDDLWRSTTYVVEGKRLVIDSVNFAWVSRNPEEAGRLYFPTERYTQKTSDGADVRVVLIHQPLNWFGQGTYRPLRSFLRNLASIVVSGHEHQGNVGINDDAESDRSAFVEGCELQSSAHGIRHSAFNVIVLDIAKEQFLSTRYLWKGSRYVPTPKGSWSTYRDLPRKRDSSFSVVELFREVMDDPGAYLRTRLQRPVLLHDIFVYPHLKLVGGADSDANTISASKLLNPAATANGVLIEGDDKSGRTTLLHRLYRDYHDRGFVPVLIAGKDLRRPYAEDVASVIADAVVAQYGTDSLSRYEQLPMSRKLILLDDFDRCATKNLKSRVALLQELRQRCGHLVITVGEMFEVKEMLGGTDAAQLRSFQHYQVRQFGFALRSKLIDKWLALTDDGRMEDSQLLARREQAERLMHAVMKRNVVPSVPLYLLVLLQSLDAGRSADFKDGALGHYYQYLLTEAFQRCGVPADKLTEVFQYCGHLAWFFHGRQNSELSESDLRRFNESFSATWHSVDFKDRLDLLIKARVLRSQGGQFVFRYPYIYYYFKGQHLAANLFDMEVRAYIGRCCAHLYVRDNADTVLFLAHHTNDEYVLNSIAEALHSLFRSNAAVTFEDDVRGISNVIESAPKLGYTGETPEAHRERRNKFRDEFGQDDDEGLIDKEESERELSQPAKITMLLKTIEILGQILKTQYSKITRVRKTELLRELFNGPLRALRDFFSFLERNPQALISEIESQLKKMETTPNEERRKKIARKAVAALVELVTLGFLMRAAQSASAESLLEDVEAVEEKNDTLAFRLIELAVLVDSPRSLPRRHLRRLKKETEGNLVASRLLQLIILNRLYMFRTSEQDMTWLSAEFNLSMSRQRAISYQTTRSSLKVR